MRGLNRLTNHFHLKMSVSSQEYDSSFEFFHLLVSFFGQPPVKYTLLEFGIIFILLTVLHGNSTRYVYKLCPLDESFKGFF